MLKYVVLLALLRAVQYVWRLASEFVGNAFHGSPKLVEFFGNGAEVHGAALLVFEGKRALLGADDEVHPFGFECWLIPRHERGFACCQLGRRTFAQALFDVLKP